MLRSLPLDSARRATITDGTILVESPFRVRVRWTVFLVPVAFVIAGLLLPTVLASEVTVSCTSPPCTGPVCPALISCTSTTNPAVGEAGLALLVASVVSIPLAVLVYRRLGRATRFRP